MKTRQRFGILATLLVGSLGIVSSADAGTNTANLSVTATVSANCSISTTALAFGAYDPVTANASSPLDGTGGVSVNCTSGSAATVTLGQGSNANTGSTDIIPLRRMADASTHRLSYFLFSDSGRTTVWGNTIATGVAQTGTGSVVALTVYGRVTAGQNVAAGSYADTVVATVTF
ncbi:MAG TPA: spore coat U domain-containing protein [Polyangiaceae bacterium]|jgi:spore coat protein U-like protein|nr:spore coat U domain-containing protein [Polyangiaceae bacterium]